MCMHIFGRKMFRAPFLRDRQCTARRVAHLGQETKLSQPTTLSSDARTEHILFAARKIGRERATVVSSVTQAERRRDAAREQERLRSNVLDRQPRRLIIDAISPRRRDRGNVAPTASGSNHYSHVAGSPRGGYLYSPSLGAGLYQHLLTPQARQVGRPPKQSPAGSSKNPPTPLDSLVDVALNMTEDSPRREGEPVAEETAHIWLGDA